MMKSVRDRRPKLKEEGNKTVVKDVQPATQNAMAVQRLRAAFGDLTNAGQKNAGTKNVLKKVKAETVPKLKVVETNGKAVVPTQPRRKVKKSSEQAQGEKKVQSLEEESKIMQGPLSEEQPAEPDISMSEQKTSDSEGALTDSRMSLDRSLSESEAANENQLQKVPEGVDDIDREDLKLRDHTLEPLYAFDIFQYYKEREKLFMVKDYMKTQSFFTKDMRGILVDWMVEVQENFEMNHETLYLGVKLVDAYFDAVPNVQKGVIQLVGATALYLASKYDERTPAGVDDFLYVCDYAFDRVQFLAMERELFDTVGFDLGRPCSYRFVRRYARCARSPVVTLYLARYLLETSLMHYAFAQRSESMMAASALYIARRMRGEGGWTPTLEYYTGYRLEELKPLILELNPILTTKCFSSLKTIRDKYSHELFHRVANIPVLGHEALFPEDPVTSEAE